MADWDWSTWMLVLGMGLICFLFVAGVLAILVILWIVARRGRNA